MRMEEPRCKYCGTEMEFEEVFDGEHYVCPECEATSPFAFTFLDGRTGAARLAALNRQKQRPMTLTELMSRDGVDDEGVKAVYQETREDGTILIALINTKYGTIHFGGDEAWLIDVSTYGRTWRCWRSMPKQEETEETKWEEKEHDGR